MTQVKMLVSIAGTLYCAFPGNVINVDDDEAARLVAVGFAELVAPEPAPVVAAPKTETPAKKGKV